MKTKIAIFGITGSIGQQALEVISKENFELVGFTYFNNYSKALEIKKMFPNAFVFSTKNTSLNNVSSYQEMIEKSKPDIILNSIVGFAGLEITILAIQNNIDIALANKESLVVAGWFINDLLKKSKSKIYPVDSEHTSIYELIKNNDKQIDEIIITASGGPFFEKNIDEIKGASFQEAIKHPNWTMGYKISIDSATLMNKCFEIIECFYLFNIRKIKAIRHKQSYVHGILKFKDNSYQMASSYPDMKLAIQQGITKFRSNTEIIKEIDFTNLLFNFETINQDLWIPIKWAYEFLETNNKVLPIILNAANEEAIELFKNNKINFLDITRIIQENIVEFKELKINNLNDIYFVDSLIRNKIRKEY